MPIDFYLSPHSPICRPVLLLAKTLGVQFNLKPTTQDDKKSPEFLKINPQHCVPTIVDNGFSLWESRAILGYLANKYGKDDSLYPNDPQKRATVDQRLYFDMALFDKMRACFVKFRDGEAADAETAKLDEALDFVDKFLEDHDFIAGSNITIADYAIAVTISFAYVIKFDMSKHPNTDKWYAKAKAAIPHFSELEEEDIAAMKKTWAARAAAKK